MLIIPSEKSLKTLGAEGETKLSDRPAIQLAILAIAIALPIAFLMMSGNKARGMKFQPAYED